MIMKNLFKFAALLLVICIAVIDSFRHKLD